MSEVFSFANWMQYNCTQNIFVTLSGATAKSKGCVWEGLRFDAAQLHPEYNGGGTPPGA